jgi:hypothetical protein
MHQQVVIGQEVIFMAQVLIFSAPTSERRVHELGPKVGEQTSNDVHDVHCKLGNFILAHANSPILD